MAISYKDIRNARQWRASTGLKKDQFLKLVGEFKITYEDLFGESIEERQSGTGNKSKLPSYEDLLFFILYSIKSGLTYDLLGLSFDIDKGTAYTTQAYGLQLLEETLQRTGDMPVRIFKDIDEYREMMKNQDTLLIDGTEQRRQRSGNQEEQKDDYSGKKKRTP